MSNKNISVSDFQGSQIEKAYKAAGDPQHFATHFRAVLQENLQKGLIDEPLYNKAKAQLEAIIERAKLGLDEPEVTIEKGGVGSGRKKIFSIYRRGGSIGDHVGENDHPKYGRHHSDHDDENKAKERAKGLNKILTPGEKQFYKIKYHVVAREVDETEVKKSESAELTKGGEGSRGGKVIGHTKSGKTIYAGHKANDYSDFTPEDHEDAANTHADLRLYGYGNNKYQHRKEVLHHSEVESSHRRAAKSSRADHHSSKMNFHNDMANHHLAALRNQNKHKDFHKEELERHKQLADHHKSEYEKHSK